MRFFMLWVLGAVLLPIAVCLAENAKKSGSSFITSNYAFMPGPEYWETPLREVQVSCVYGGEVDLDGGMLRCSTHLMCGNGADPRLDRRDGGGHYNDAIVCDARRDGGVRTSAPGGAL